MISQSTIIKFVLFGVVVFGFGVIALNFISHSRRQDDFVPTEEVEAFVAPMSNIDTLNNTSADFKSDIKPPKKLSVNNSKIGISKIPIRTYKISINNEEHKNILVREAGQGNFHVLLLHGQKFTSKIWETIGTLQLLSKWGYRAFAIDIPSNGSNSLPVTDDAAAVEWLTKLIRTLGLSNVVLISPSMSGRLALPYIFQLKKEQKLIRAFVPIAPVGTDTFPNYDYRQVNIPTLVVHAEKDSSFQAAYELLIQIPTSEVLFMINAGHDSYVDEPNNFHNGLRQFLYKVYRPIYKKSLLSYKRKSKTKQ